MKIRGRFRDVNLRRSAAAEFQRWTQRIVDRGPMGDGQFQRLANLIFRLSGSQVRLVECAVDPSTGFHQLVLADGTGQTHTVCQQSRILGYRSFPSMGRILAESYGLERVTLRDEDVLIDVGANTGDLCLYLQWLSNERAVRPIYIGVEPGPAEYACLKQNSSGLPGMTFPVALGSTSGWTKLFYTPQTADSSIVEPPDFESILDVEMMTLDELVKGHVDSSKEVRFLKLEAEGYEFEVLQGGSSSLHRIQWIAADLGFERGLEQRATAPEVIPYLLDQGFVLDRLTQPSCVRYLFRRKDVTR